MRRLVPLALAAALAFAVAGCGAKPGPSAPGGGSLQPFRVVLDYFPNADHAAIYAAQADGEFRRAGLDVQLITPSDPSAPLRLLEAGRADLAISYEPEVLLARDKGSAVLSVGALVQKPLTTVMALGSANIHSAADLRGKTVGTAGIPYQAAYLKTILARAHVPASSVKTVDVGFSLLPAMLSKRVDATLGAYWNYEGVALQQRRKSPSILHVEDLGVPTYDELVFAARRTSLRPAEASKIRRFLEAVARGAKTAQRDPGLAVRGILAANHGADPRLEAAAVKATLPVFEPASAKHPFGWQDDVQWHAYASWMRRNGLLSHPVHGEDAITNEFLPGQGVPDATSDNDSGP